MSERFWRKIARFAAKRGNGRFIGQEFVIPKAEYLRKNGLNIEYRP